MPNVKDLLGRYALIADELGRVPDRRDLEESGERRLAMEIAGNCGFRYLARALAWKRAGEARSALDAALAEFTGIEEEGNMPRRYFELVESERDMDTLARSVVGRNLVRAFPGGEERRMILTELGAYYGIARSTHGKTAMGYPSGTVWVNSRYGRSMLNIATGDIEHPGCLVVRGGFLEGSEHRELRGPDAVVRSLQIGQNVNGTVLGEAVRIEGRQRAGEVAVGVPRSQPSNCIGYYVFAPKNLRA